MEHNHCWIYTGGMALPKRLLRVFESMKRSEVKPDQVTMIIICYIGSLCQTILYNMCFTLSLAN